MRETELVKACVEYLRLRGILAWRQNVGAAVTSTPGQKRRFVRFACPGISDILGCLPDGRFLAVECKVGRGRVTAAQAEFLGRVEAAGGLALIVYSLDKLRNGLDDYGRNDT